MLQQHDPKVAHILQNELKRQEDGFELIASENFVSPAVLEALGSVMTNKYSEGFPNKRYYGGNDFIDDMETLAQTRAKELFGVDHVNVQPYSGSPAVQEAIFAVTEPGDTIMGLHLLYGGHLTHGWKVNFSAKYYNAVQFTTDENGFIDYDVLAKQVLEHKPKVIITGSTGIPRIWDYARIGKIARSVDAYYIADIAHEAGFVAAGLIASPVSHADIITTTTHKTLRGPRGAMIMCNGNPSNPLKAVNVSRENLPTLVDRAVFPGLQGGPHNHTTAAIAVALGEALQPEYKTYMAQVGKNAKALAQTLLDEGLSLVTGGTDNHLMIADVTSLDIGGKIAEEALGEVEITVNKNTIPADTRKPFDPSGIRIGTPAMTSRGFTEAEFKIVGQLIAKTLKNVHNDTIKAEIKATVHDMCKQFPLYPDLQYVT